ncbi:MAG: nuclear transport factor 2 family protein [Gammaproteobacteria bacterium]|nr:nuclear transport factor 2 family protein [Gammaproteobacteria bacterium]
MNKMYNTPQEAEAAFYDAVERGDLPVLSEVWSDNENIVCIHAGSQRIEGRSAVLDSFVDFIADNPCIEYSITDTLQTGTDSLAIHLVREEIEIDGQVVSVMVATNIYHREMDGWRMLLHHSSHEPDHRIADFFEDFDDFETEQESPPVLH